MNTSTLAMLTDDLKKFQNDTLSLINEAMLITGDSKSEETGLTVEFMIAKTICLYLLSKGVDKDEVKSFLAKHGWFLPIGLYNKEVKNV